MSVHQRGGRITHDPVEIRGYSDGDRLFITACQLAGLKPTRRQYRKWLLGNGTAHAYKNAAKRVIEDEDV